MKKCTLGDQAPRPDIVRKAATSDLLAQRNEFLFKFPVSLIQKQLIPMLQNPRDLPIVYLFSNIIMLTVPAALAIFNFAPTSHIVGAAYFILNYVLFLQRFMLALHYSEHRKLFRSGKNDTYFHFLLINERKLSS